MAKQISITKKEFPVIILDDKATMKLVNDSYFIQGNIKINILRGHESDKRGVEYNPTTNKVSVGCQSYSYERLMDFLEYLQNGKKTDKKEKCILKKGGKTTKTKLKEESENFYISTSGRAYPKSGYEIIEKEISPLFKKSNWNSVKNQLSVYDRGSYSYERRVTEKEMLRVLTDIKTLVEAIKSFK